MSTPPRTTNYLWADIGDVLADCSRLEDAVRRVAIGTTHNIQTVAPTPNDPALAVLDAVSTERREIAYNFMIH
eukprot:gene3275-10003_t